MSIATVYKKVAGLDIHKSIVVATIQIEESDGNITEKTQSFGTLPQDLNKLATWLYDMQIELAVMESTGVYWKTVYNALEDKEIKTFVVNARHIKKVPGRKTDLTDSQWLASLGRCGLVKGSFVPEKKLRDLRLLTRYRLKLTYSLSSEKNRLHKILDDAGIRIGAVLTHIQGMAAQTIIYGVIKGEEPQELMKRVTRIKPEKRKILLQMLKSPLSKSHQYVLQTIVSLVDDIQSKIDDLDKQIFEFMDEHYHEAWHLLQTIPGINKNSAAAIIAETGIDMKHFGSVQQFCSWAGLCPGNNESAGKKKHKNAQGQCDTKKDIM